MNEQQNAGSDAFDTPEEFDQTGSSKATETAAPDPARPSAVRGRYHLPNPENGKSKSWQRVTNFIKLTEDTYHLELWKQRNVAKGVALLAATRPPSFLTELAASDVREDKDRLNNIASRAQAEADAWKMSEEGTALHKSAEDVDYANGDITRAPAHHREKIRLYRDALAVNGIAVVPELIERVTASTKYQVAGKFDRIYRLTDGSYVLADLKTGDSLDFAMASIAAQLEAYEDGVNTVGIFDGQRYRTDIKVRRDFALVVHLPSTRNEVTVHALSLDQGRAINEVNLAVREARRIKSKHVARKFHPEMGGAVDLVSDQYWLERLNAAASVDEMAQVAANARALGGWNERLSQQARIIAAEHNA